jgi:hypothetical protein
MNQLSQLIREFKWVAYPVAVLLFVLLTIKFLVGKPGEILTQKSITESAQIVSQLKSKLDFLNSLDQSKTLEDLGWLGGVVPTDKEIGIIISQLRYTSGLANSQLLAYSTKLGDVASTGSGEFVISANFAVPDMPSLVQLISSLNSSLPLVSISTVRFAAGSASFEINGAWFPLVSHQARIEDALPDYTQALSDLKSRLGGFTLVQTETVEETTPEVGEILVNPNPFTPLAN